MNKIKTELRVFSFAFSDSLKSIFTDPGAILVLVFASLFYPVVYSIAYSNEVLTKIPVVIVDNDNTQTSRLWGKMMDATPAIDIVNKAADMVKAQDFFWSGQANAIIIVPEGFEKSILKGEQASVSMYADGSNFLFYKETFRATSQATGSFSAGIEYKRFLAKGLRHEQAVNRIQPIKTTVYNLYNPSGAYGSFVMPGIMIIILQQTLLIGIGIIGGAGRERKRNHVTIFGFDIRNHAVSLILGKSLAYFVVGFFNLMFATVLVYHWFSFPAKGEFINVVVLAIPFLFSIIFMGLTLSLLFYHREHSIMVLVFLSPIVLFITGLSWPLQSIPHILHEVFRIFPTTHMVPAYLRLRTMGVSLNDVQPELRALFFQMIAYFAFAVGGFKIAMHKNTAK